MRPTDAFYPDCKTDSHVKERVPSIVHFRQFLTTRRIILGRLSTSAHRHGASRVSPVRRLCKFRLGTGEDLTGDIVLKGRGIEAPADDAGNAGIGLTIDPPKDGRSKIFTAFDSQSIPISRLQRIGLQFAGWIGHRVFRKIDGDAKRAAGPQLTIPAMTWAYAQWFAFCIEAYIAAQASD